MGNIFLYRIVARLNLFPMAILLISLPIFILLLILSNYFGFNYWIDKDTVLWKKLLFFSGNGLGFGFMTSILGFFLGASVGDESAGSIAVYMFVAGGVGGFILAFIVSLIWYFVKY